MSIDRQQRWCVFTSAGERNAIRRWLAGDTPRRWDLVVAYYGDDEQTFSEISKPCIYAFRTKGSKFQNLRKLLLQSPNFFDRYSHVWVCDDDIQMSTAQINEAFEITEALGFWVAQPAMRSEGKNSHWINCYAGPQWDYRIVNFVEVGLPIFRRDKLIEFMAVYDGSLTGWGIDQWYANVFNANEFGRFAIIDRIQVTNPYDLGKRGHDIDSLQTAALRSFEWQSVRKKYGLVEPRDRVIAYCKLAPKEMPQRQFRCAALAVLQTLRRSGWREAMWLVRCGLTTIRQVRATNDYKIRHPRPAGISRGSRGYQ
jgi:hypothetical protein